MMGNYRYNYLQLAEQFLKEGEPDSARYWLDYGLKVIPLREDEEVSTIIALYANRYAQIGESDKAIEILDSSLDRFNKNLDYEFNRFMEVLDQQAAISAQYEQARRNADIKAQRTLTQRNNALVQQARSLSQSIMREQQSIIIIQYVYFKAGADEKGLEIAERVNTKFEGTQIPTIPKTRQESIQRGIQYGLN